MTKKDLMTGDIVVHSSGRLAVVIKNCKEDYFLYQSGGWESLDDYDDDMNYLYPENEDHLDAIMQVYRVSSGGISFSDYEDEEMVYERDYTWSKPDTEANKEAFVANKTLEITQPVESPENKIRLISQAFYGNRTGTAIKETDIDRFILGYLDDKLEISEPINRTVIRLPDSEKLVLIYNKYQELERLEDKERALKESNYIIKPLATIPEMNLEIYSRCIVCRINSVGDIESVQAEDYEIWNRYLAK